MAKHTVCHIEFEVADLDRSQKFFATLFDWQFRAFGDSMVVFGVGDDHIGGLVKRETPRIAPTAGIYFEVEDLDGSMATAVKAGGSIVSPRQDVPHVGWSAEFSDPDGNPIGLVQFDRSQA